MKNLVILLVSLLAGLTLSAKEKVTIGALQKVELTYAEFSNYNVQLSNRSGKQVDVAVIDPTTNQQVKGFGLGPMGTVVVSVGEGQVLTLKNKSTKEISISLDFVERKTEVLATSNTATVAFTLHNSSIKSIPLVIPNVMNPNLSPISNSGVSLNIGQKIYYRKGGKKKLLLVVDDTIKQGDKIDVAEMIKALEKDS